MRIDPTKYGRSHAVGREVPLSGRTSAAPPSEREMLNGWIDALKRPRRELTVWETLFLESVAEQLDRRGSLSPKQQETLERIYAEKSS